MSEPLPCAECGADAMRRVVQTCDLTDGLHIKRLAHYRCSACGARFFDDAAMHMIQAARREPALLPAD